MFLDDPCAKGNRDHGRDNAQSVVGQTDRDTKGLRHVGNRQQVHAFKGGRIGAAAFQQRDAGCPRTPGGHDSLMDFFLGGHASGHDDRFPGGCDEADQGQVDQFE